MNEKKDRNLVVDKEYTVARVPRKGRQRLIQPRQLV